MSTKKELTAELGISANTLKKVLEAIGLETSKENYSDEEVEKIRLGRSMIAEEKKSYEEVKEHFQGRKILVGEVKEGKKEERTDPIRSTRDIIQQTLDLEIQRVTDEAMIDALERLPEFFQESINRAISNGTIDRLQAGFRGGNQLNGFNGDQFVDVESEEVS